MNLPFIFQRPDMLGMLIGLPLVLGVVIIGILLRRTAMQRFFGVASGRPWALGASTPRLIAKGALLTLALAAVIFASARPGSDPQPKTVSKTGRDVVFLVDVSRSMLAGDVKPNRLARAKLLINDVLDVAEGDRIGVVAFAGAAVVKCPMTTDYAFARLSLDDLSPESVSRGGTAIGEAIRTGLSQLFPDGKDAKDDGRARLMFLITDGEDHESAPLEAAEAAGKKNVRIVTIGLGSDLAGAPVPAASGQMRQGQQTSPSGFVQYEGETVTSRMDSSSLKAIAEATPGGVFLNVGTGNVDLDRVYKRVVRAAQGGQVDTQQTMRYTEWFQAFIGLSLVLLAMEGLIDARRK